jgi:glycine/D-amino acid oxidase-like deaminating enzyme
MPLAASPDVLVLGGGLLGASIAFGLARHGAAVTVLDEGDVAFRASRGNFGLVWVQNKGVGLPFYAQWSRDAAALWPELARELLGLTGIDVRLQQPGGFYLCFTDAEMESRQRSLEGLRQGVAGPYPFEMMDRAALRERLPALGPEVVGGSYTPMDGHVNPLKLYRSLHAACLHHGVRVVAGSRVERITHGGGTFRVETAAGVHAAPQIVLAAGLGNARLASQVGLHAPVVPSRGQILVTERLRPFLDHPTNKLRQTDEGTVQIGDSVEDVGYDDTTTLDVLQFMARRAVRAFPLLRDANIVRAWGALRVMTPDGFPLYEESRSCPGAFVATCHSGVTLAATHALRVAPWIAGGLAPEGLAVFGSGRFAQPSRTAMYVN